MQLFVESPFISDYTKRLTEVHVMRKALISIPVALLSVSAAPASRPAINVQVASLLDIRQTDDLKRPLGNSLTPLRVELILNGDIGNVHGIPKVRILECRDDLGDALRDEAFPSISPRRADGKLRVGVAVSQPPRRAQRISLKGEIEVY